MSQAIALIELFHQNNNQLTLGQILDNWKLVGSKYTNRISELRKMGYTVTCKTNYEVPTLNVYTLIEPGNHFYDGQKQGNFVLGV